MTAPTLVINYAIEVTEKYLVRYFSNRLYSDIEIIESELEEIDKEGNYIVNTDTILYFYDDEEGETIEKKEPAGFVTTLSWNNDDPGFYIEDCGRELY